VDRMTSRGLLSIILFIYSMPWHEFLLICRPSLRSSLFRETEVSVS
jgi:hypothetical protein